MNEAQSGTPTNIVPVQPSEIVPDEILKHSQEQFITFLAAGNLVEQEDGKMVILSIIEFSDKMNIPRRTLYNWKRDIPDFQQRVARRRHEIFSQERVSKVWVGLYLRAKKGDAKQAEMILSHFSDYVPPTQKVEHDVGGGLAELMQKARERAQQKKPQAPIQAEIINAPSSPTAPTSPTTHA